jgi:signal transduction histidine kinase
MLAIASRLQSPEDQLEALQKLIALSPAIKTKAYFTRYQKLNDSLQTARNAAKNQFALIRYDAEKSKADNLRLQKDNSEKKYQLIRQSIRFYTMLAAFLALTGIALLRYRKWRQRKEQEKQEAIRETQRKASKKVHDTLANDVYRIMKEVQHSPAPDKDKLVYEINDVYLRARDISYEIAADKEEPFHERLSALLTAFGTETIRVSLVGNRPELWGKIDTARQFEHRYILQELMVNMQKHSGAANVVIKFEEQDGRCRISYADDGIGLPANTPHKNGLTNTGNRIKAMQGDLIFDSNPGKGLHIQLSFPIA